MFALHMPWWEFPLRAAIAYGVLLVLVRVSGKRTVGKFTPFDLLVVMLLGSCVSSGMTAGDTSILAGLLIAATLVILNRSVAFIVARSGRMQLLLEGRAILVGRDGVIYTEVLKSQRVPVSDVLQALRQADCDQAEMRFAFLESDGEISILKSSCTK